MPEQQKQLNNVNDFDGEKTEQIRFIVGLDKKEAVEETLKELKEEKRKRSQSKRKVIIKILSVLFFPVALLNLLIKVIAKKVRIPITVKMLLIYTVVFSLILIGFTVFFIKSIEPRLSSSEDGVSYLQDLTLTSTILVSLFIAVFAALIGVVSSLMLNPIRKITDGIDEITTENLSKRLEVVDTQDELMELTNRINDMLNNIEETFLRQQNFVSDASHELKTPIAVVQGYSNLLKRWGAKDEKILFEAIDSIHRESENMKRIVEQLLLLARLGKMNMNVTEFDLCEVLDSMIEDYRLVAKNHTINYKRGRDIFLLTDKNLLLECLRTIVDNAIKYTPENGTITVACSYKVNYVQISIQDNGIGIAQEDLPRIFDRFFRCDKARGREKGSSGLGLTIAKSIIEMLGGEITVKSELGKGTTFVVSLY